MLVTRCLFSYSEDRGRVGVQTATKGIPTSGTFSSSGLAVAEALSRHSRARTSLALYDGSFLEGRALLELAIGVPEATR